MESQPQNPELRNNPENFHPCIAHLSCSLNGFRDFLISNMGANYPWVIASLDPRGMVGRINIGDYCVGLFKS